MQAFSHLLRQSLPFTTSNKSTVKRRQDSLKRPLFYGTEYVYEDSNSDDEGENRLEDRFPVDEDLVSASFFLKSKKRLDQLRTGIKLPKENIQRKEKGAHLESALTADTLTSSRVLSKTSFGMSETIEEENNTQMQEEGQVGQVDDSILGFDRTAFWVVTIEALIVLYLLLVTFGLWMVYF